MIFKIQNKEGKVVLLTTNQEVPEEIIEKLKNYIEKYKIENPNYNIDDIGFRVHSFLYDEFYFPFGNRYTVDIDC